MSQKEISRMDLIQYWSSKQRDMKFELDTLNATLKHMPYKAIDETLIFIYRKILLLKEETARVESIIARLKNGNQN